MNKFGYCKIRAHKRTKKILSKFLNAWSRQNNRAKFSKLIYNSKNYSQILKSINKINKIKKSKHKDKDFGSGNSDKKLEKILLGKKFWKLNIQKTFNDLDKIWRLT